MFYGRVRGQILQRDALRHTDIQKKGNGGLYEGLCGRGTSPITSRHYAFPTDTENRRSFREICRITLCLRPLGLLSDMLLINTIASVYSP